MHDIQCLQATTAEVSALTKIVEDAEALAASKVAQSAAQVEKTVATATESVSEVVGEGENIVEISLDAIENQSIIKNKTRLFLEKQTTSELLKSKKSFEALIQEHKKKLSDYINNPKAFDNLNHLENISPEIEKSRIQGRIKNLEKQIAQQLQKLLETINILQGRGDL